MLVNRENRSNPGLACKRHVVANAHLHTPTHPHTHTHTHTHTPHHTTPHHTTPHHTTHTPRSIQTSTNHMCDFLLGLLQHMAQHCYNICYLTESFPCYKFHLGRPNHLSFKRIFKDNLIVFHFHSFDFLFKK